MRADDVGSGIKLLGPSDEVPVAMVSERNFVPRSETLTSVGTWWMLALPFLHDFSGVASLQSLVNDGAGDEACSISAQLVVACSGDILRSSPPGCRSLEVSPFTLGRVVEVVVLRCSAVYGHREGVVAADGVFPCDQVIPCVVSCRCLSFTSWPFGAR